MDNLIGKKLDGRYLIESLIGVGGMAKFIKAAMSAPATRSPSRC